MHDWYAQLIALRRATPELLDGRRGRTRCTWGEGWFVLYRDRVAVVCNLGADRRTVEVEGTPIEAMVASTTGFVYAAGAVDLDGESVVVIRLG